MGPNEVVNISYHMNWPGAGNDPFYVNNPTENTARRTYYGINAVFNMKVDGVLGNTGSQYQNYYNQRCNIPSPLLLDETITVGTTINVTATITAEAGFAMNNLKLRAALIELAYDITGGGWTYTHCERAMLDMSPDPNGINFNITGGQTVTQNISFPMPTYPPTGPENLAVVIFVQRDDTREVLQAHHEQIPLNYPSLSLMNYTVTDNAPGGNGNGIPEAGETCLIWMTLQNGGPFAPANNVSGVLSSTDPAITITDPNATFPNMSGGQQGNNQSNPYVFLVSNTLTPHIVQFRMDVTANAGAYTNFYYINFLCGMPEILIVDDDGGATYEIHYQADLDSCGEVYVVWHTATQGTPTGTYLLGFDKVIWFTSMQTAPISTAEQTVIGQYLDGGGKLFISSENMGDNIGTTAWYGTYMHAQHLIDHVTSTSLSGYTGDPISNGQSFLIIGPAYWADNQSAINPLTPAVQLYHYNNTAQNIAALRYEATYKLVYMAFPFECINPAPTGAYTPRADVMQSILNWFGGAPPPPPPLTVTLTPVNPPIVIPATGGSFNYNTSVTNNSNTPQNFQYWIMVTLPTGTNYGPVLGPVALTLNPAQTIARTRTQAVPASAPAGTYVYHAYVGAYPNNITAQAQFNFSKSAIDGAHHLAGGNWNCTGEPFPGESENTIKNYQLCSVYPNPFNPSTTISFELRDASFVSLTVYDITGKEIAVLANGRMEAGNHIAVFDGFELASGIYFYEIKTDFGEYTGKMLLLK
jgi:hypothetical protein